jgi:hypothetical protein
VVVPEGRRVVAQVVVPVGQLEYWGLMEYWAKVAPLGTDERRRGKQGLPGMVELWAKAAVVSGRTAALSGMAGLVKVLLVPLLEQPGPMVPREASLERPA